MKKPTPLNDDDLALFRQELGQTRAFVQDKAHFPRPQKKKAITRHSEQTKLEQAEFFFSDEYEPDIDGQKVLSYVKAGHNSFLAKQLRRGEYTPELILDLHGLNKEDSKAELIALINACKKQHVQCASIMHGIGERVLKNKIPHYLVQHPDVIAMHQAPLEWGGKSAILILVDLHLPHDPKY
ncbi:endonuclease SmrB [Pseudoalteromonas ulvae]|uniref:Ribosome rescue factor SmrB n=1 Tax=Pseudoalteromonas ulvae TaxID=107327 RepID=A0A244CSB0_PSEDV|nr:endonuclease SmrB [Pseudoalteromonas ulvae]OUL58510.1 endonuclease SmrB [Pseudoalteromonas ulvae]